MTYNLIHRRFSESTHFSRGSNAVVQRDAGKISLVDLSSVRLQANGGGPGGRPLSSQQQKAIVEGIAAEMARLAQDLDTMQVI